MIKILRSYGIPDTIVNAIEASYASTRAKVYSPDGVTEEFDIYILTLYIYINFIYI